MPDEIHFAFNQPVGILFGYGFLVVAMAYPVWKIWRIRAMSGSVRGFLFSRRGFPFLLIILLGVFWLYLVTAEAYTGFWTLHVMGRERLTLDYWFPRPDRIVHPQDIQEVTLTTNQRHSKGEMVNQYWLISLTSQEGTEYTSVDIHSEDKAKQAINALENWMGRSHVHYLKDCSDAWGVVCSTSRVSRE